MVWQLLYKAISHLSPVLLGTIMRSLIASWILTRYEAIGLTAIWGTAAAGSKTA